MKKTIQLSISFFLALNLISCATFTADNYKQINVFSNIKDANFILNDTVYSNPATLKVKRDNKPLIFTLKSDSLNVEKEYKVKHKPNPTIFSGNFPMVIAAPVGIIVDMTNKKRFTYPSVIQLNYFENLPELDQLKAKRQYHKEHNRTIEQYAKLQYKKDQELSFQNNILREKGDRVHNYIISGLTGFIVNAEGREINTVGLMRVGYGMDYFYQNNKFLSVDGIVKTNLIDPFFSLIFSELFVINPELNITNNYRFNRFEVGYGLSFQYMYYNSFDNCWSCNNDEPPFTGALITDQKPDIKEGYFSLGLKAQTFYQLGRRLYVGMFYQPSFLKFSSTSNNTKPDHYFGFDLRFKAKASKK